MIFKRNDLYRGILSWFHLLLLLFGFYPLSVSFLGLNTQNTLKMTALGLLLLIPIISSSLMLRKIRNFWIFVPCGLLIAAGTGYLAYCLCDFFQYGRYLGGILTFLLSLIPFIIHIHARVQLVEIRRDFIAAHGSSKPFAMETWEVSTPANTPRFSHLTWLVIQYIAGILLGFSTYWHIIFYLTFLDVFLCFLYQYRENYLDFVETNDGVANLPLQTLQKIFRILYALAFLLLIIFTLPAALYGREPLSEISISSHTILHVEQDTDSLSIPPNSTQQIVPEIIVQAQNDSTPDPVWFANLLKVLLFIMGIVLILSLIYAIVQGIKKIGADFCTDENDSIEFLEDKTKDDKKKLRKQQKKKEGYLSPNMQIRRKYKRMIKRNTKGTPSSTATPSELERRAGIAEEPNTTLLHSMYEKARYSKMGCGKEDLQALNKTTS
ncbi:MAG: hypothetical protein MR355_05340 [Lachnospiraceae bacterium]|nr:hypothetical protein [Lachnospiraceae bacterium]